MSYSNSFPQQRPTLNLDFANSGKLDSRISFSRADTPPTYAAPSAVHYWSNEKHLSSENLLLQSQDFDTSWSGIDLASSVSGGHSAPDGSSTGWLMTANTGTSQEPQLQQLFAINSSTEYTAIAHLKAGTASHGYVSLRGGGGGHYAYASIDFSAGTVADGGSGFTGISSSITALSDSWYKVTVTATSDSTTSSPYCFIGISDGSAFASHGTVPYDSNGETMYAWGAQLSSTNSLVYDSPTTTQISREYSSTLKSVSNSGDPRFEYSPTDGQSVGLLIEASASNLFTYSHELNQWTSARSTIDQNSAIGPTGELTADTLRIDGTDTDSHYISQTPSVTSGTAYTSSAYVKPAGLTHFAVRFQSAFTDSLVIFNATTGTVTSNSQSLSTSATSVGNGWFRLSATATATSSTSAAITIYGCDTDSSVNVATGDSFRGLLITGLQFEGGSAPSSLIQTSGSSVTRAADSCSVAVSDFAGFADTEGAVVVEATVNSLDSGNAAAVSLSNAAGTEYIKTGYEVGGVTDQSVRAYVRGSSLDQAYIDAGSVSATGSYRVGVRYEKNNVGVSLNGASAVTDTVATMPIGMNTLYIGSSSTGTNPLNANLKRIAYYSEPLSDTNLTALTSS